VGSTMIGLQPYASRTGTRRNLDALRQAGWHLLISATGVWRSEGFPYALDNGAWTAHQQGTQFDGVRFLALLRRFGAGANWCVVPDIVGAGMRSLQFSLTWLPYVQRFTPLPLIAVQDGMEPNDVAPHLGKKVGIFVGGSTDWKVGTLLKWGKLAKSVGCYLHVGRVNTVKRINLCLAAGADSFDGTSVTRFAKTLPMLDHARRQQDFFA